MSATSTPDSARASSSAGAGAAASEPAGPAAAAEGGSRVREVLAGAVEALGGARRDGQVAMAEAVAEAMVEGRHLLVQAGTGTGKSLAYLVPSLLHDQRVVVATATLALQHQLVERDIPRLVEAVGSAPGVDTSYAVLKGRSNYACLHRIREGAPDDQGALVELPTGSMGQKVLELRAWAEEEAENRGSGERDNAPRHTDREWRQVSVGHRDPGAAAPARRARHPATGRGGRVRAGCRRVVRRPQGAVQLRLPAPHPGWRPR